jgi:hypothetical protein
MSKAQKEKIIFEIKELSEKAAIKLTLDIHERLLLSTPVDTGWARANWIPSINIPVRKADGSPELISTGEQDKGALELTRWRFSMGPAYITNNVPYITTLNEGSSKQAPSGFVQKSVSAAIQKATRERLKR